MEIGSNKNIVITKINIVNEDLIKIEHVNNIELDEQYENIRTHPNKDTQIIAYNSDAFTIVVLR